MYPILAFLLVTTTTTTTTALSIQVIGGAGRMGSQWMRLLGEEAVAVPRGAAAASSENNNTIAVVVVCTSAAAWPSLRRQYSGCWLDLIFVGNGCIEDDDDDATYVIPHYAISRVGAPPTVQEGAPPTYVVGPQARWVQQQLLSDGIPNVRILTDHSTAQQYAVRKLLWASVMWLLCHEHGSTPITVRTVHTTQADRLRRLVRELWPVVCERMRLDDNSSSTTASTHDDDDVLFEETLQYLQDYSLSIPTSIPSVTLALAELEVRNAVFAGPDQPLHRALLEQVAGSERTNDVFGRTTTTNNNADDTTCFVPLPSLGMTVSGDRRQQQQQRKRTVIIGAGILGSSIALHLSSHEHHDVTVVDAGDALAYSATTRASWAWINANRKRPLHYQHLNAWGMHTWRHHPELQDLVDWTGTLVRRGHQEDDDDDDDGDDSLGGFYARPQGPLTAAEWLALEPNAGFPADEGEGRVYHYPNEGCVDPMEAVARMRTLAQQQGTKFLWNSHVESSTTEAIAEDGNDVEHPSSRIRILDVNKNTTFTLTADTIVVAAGVGTTALCGLPMRHSPGRIAFAKGTEDGRLRKILVDTLKKSHILQRRNGDLVIGGGELEVGGSSSPSSKELQPPNMSTGLTTGSASTIPDLTTLEASNELVTISEALRPIPQDGLPCIGFLRPGYYVATTHSAVTLAPLLGALVALEVDDGIDLDMLQYYRPGRLFPATSG